MSCLVVCVPLSVWDNDAIASKLETASEIQSATAREQDEASETKNANANANANDETTHSPTESGTKYATSWTTQYKTLTHRGLKKSKFSVFSPVNILKTVATGIAVGVVYLNKSYTESDVFNIYAYFFFVMLYWVMDGMFAALFSFPQERIVILKERATASYRLSAYFCAMTTADLPIRLFMPFIFLVISYWMAVPTLGISVFLLIL